MTLMLVLAWLIKQRKSMMLGNKPWNKIIKEFLKIVFRLATLTIMGAITANWSYKHLASSILQAWKVTYEEIAT